MKYHTHKWLFSESTPQCFHMTTIMSKREGVSFSRCPVVTSALLNKRERKENFLRWRVKAPVGGSALSFFPSSPLLSALMAMKTPLNDLTTKNATHWYWKWWQEQRKLQHRDGILSHHSTFIYTVVLKDYYIYMPWYLHYTPRVCQTTWRYQDTRIFLTEINNTSLNPYKNVPL